MSFFMSFVFLCNNISELNKSQLVSLAKKCFENGQYINVISYLKEVNRLGYPLNYFERELIYDSFYKLKSPFYNILNDSKTNKRLYSDLIKNA